MNNLPDKIYLATTEEAHDLDNSFVGIAHSDPEDIIGPVEYIRKDAFIKKLETWLNKRHKRDRYTLIYFRKHFKNIINEIMKD